MLSKISGDRRSWLVTNLLFAAANNCLLPLLLPHLGRQQPYQLAS